MERVIASVYLPAAEKTYDVRLPWDLNAGKAAELVSQALAELSDGAYLRSRAAVLIWRETGQLLNPRQTLRQCGVKNTSKLMII